MKSRILMALGMVAAASVASADLITATNFDTLGPLGTQIASYTSPIVYADSTVVGALASKAYDDGAGTFTYVLQVTPTAGPGHPPASAYFDQFNTSFFVVGLGSSPVVGYSFGQASSAGVTFDVVRDPDGTLDWEVTNGGSAPTWTAGETITLFFQSTAGPVLKAYNTSNGSGGQGIGVGVPEPSSLLLLGAGLVGLAAAFRRRAA